MIGGANATIPGSVAAIGPGAFNGRSSLSQNVIPDNVTSIGELAFNYCSGLTEITIPGSVTSIGRSAFFGCSGLARMTVLAETPPTGGANMFTGSTCPIYVPAASVEAYKAAEGWSSYADRIQAIAPETQPNNEIWYTSTDGQVVNPSFADYGISAESAFGGALIVSNVYEGGKGKITFDRDVTRLANSFQSCSTLLTISYPETVTFVSSYTFMGCTSLTGDVWIPEGQEIIYQRTFSLCSSLTSVVIPEGVKEIKVNAFAQCSKLSEITIPKTVTTIGDYVFTRCSGLTRITVLAETPPTSGKNPFNETNCPIYVPAGSVEAYKAAAYWSDYADRIQAMP
jgi:hypothetical protein